eukprot:gene3021-9281_t
MATDRSLLTDKQLKETFDLFDADSSGAIDADELGLAPTHDPPIAPLAVPTGAVPSPPEVMEGLGFGRLSKEDIDDLVRQLDRDGSGVIEFKEFQQICKTKTAQRGGRGRRASRP